MRLRRLRRTSAVRDLQAETRLSRDQLIMPHFVVSGQGTRSPIPSMPRIDHVSPDRLCEDVASDLELGIRTVLLFGVPRPGEKDATGSAARDPTGAVPAAVRALKRRFGDDVTVVTDVCICPYTNHGHCGVVENGRVLNDPSLDLLSALAVCHAEAGADWVAPSDMMDGRVRHMRAALDGAGHSETAILSYSVKYASGYYGPFRDAAHSSPATGDRKTYQMDVRNVREAVREARQDAEEGADAVMVKPALAYLDVIRAVREGTDLPLACYNVSGEYSMVKHAAAAGLLDEGVVVRENLAAFARAGADWIITYHAREAARNGWLP